jgi:hypothetical protein
MFKYLYYIYIYIYNIMSYGLYGLNSRINYLQYQIDTILPAGPGAGLTSNNIFTGSNTFDAGLTTDQILVDGAVLSIGEPATTTTMIGDTDFSTQVPTCSIDATTSSELCNYNTVVGLISAGATPSLGAVMLVDNDASADLAMGVHHIIGNTIVGIDTSTDLNIGLNIANADINIGDPLGIGDVNIYSQAVFDLPPHVPTPLLGNDAASKGYVDTLIGNYSGSGLNLYLNKSQPSINQLGSFILSTTVSAAALQTEQTTALGTALIASFITPTGFPNLTILPIGLWQMTVYGYTTSSTGTLFYSFKLYKQPLVGVAVLIGTSGDSSDVNATSALAPDAFHMSLAITSPVTMLLTDCLLVDVISVGLGMGGTVKLNTVFEDGYYSFVNTNLSGGTSLLTTDNTWTGINNFSLGVQTGAIDRQSAGGLTIGTVEATSINIGRAGIITTVAGTLAATTLTATSLQNNSLTSNGVSSIINHYIANTGGTYSLFTGAGRTGTTNIQTAATGANAINIGSTTSTTSIKGLRASTIDASGALSIGSDAVTTSINMNNKVLSGLTLGVNQFINLSSNTYSATTGTTVVGSIGYMYVITTPNGAGFVNGANLTSGASQVYGTIPSIPAGVYIVSCTIGLTTVAGNTFQNFWASISSSAYNNRSTPPSGPNTDYYYNISGVVAYTTATTLDANLFSIFSGNAPKMLSANFRLSAVRIA